MKDNSLTRTTSPGWRAASYWFVDGLPDMLLGMTLLIFGSFGLWWCLHTPKHWAQPDFFLVAVGVSLFYWKGRAMLDFLKSRVTYPRTGYVQPPEDFSETPVPPDFPITLSLSPGPPPEENVIHFNTRTVYVVFGWCFFFLVSSPWESWGTPLAMLALALPLWAWNRRTVRPYRWWSALMLPLAGLALMGVDVSPLLQQLLLPLRAGAWLMAQGGSTLVNYLRANPNPRAPESVRA